MCDFGTPGRHLTRKLSIRWPSSLAVTVTWTTACGRGAASAAFAESRTALRFCGSNFGARTVFLAAPAGRGFGLAAEYFEAGREAAVPVAGRAAGPGFGFAVAAGRAAGASVRVGAGFSTLFQSPFWRG